jgi:hypothetical protein
VFIVQTRLVAAQRVDLHMKLGLAALVLAVAIVGVGFATTAALGVAYRRRAAYHKRFMLLAMIAVLSPAALC